MFLAHRFPNLRVFRRSPAMSTVARWHLISTSLRAAMRTMNNTGWEGPPNRAWQQMASFGNASLITVIQAWRTSITLAFGCWAAHCCQLPGVGDLGGHIFIANVNHRPSPVWAGTRALAWMARERSGRGSTGDHGARGRNSAWHPHDLDFRPRARPPEPPSPAGRWSSAPGPAASGA